MSSELDSTIRYYRERYPRATHNNLAADEQHELLAGWVADQPGMEAFDAFTIEETDRVMAHVAQLVSARHDSDEAFNAACAALGLTLVELIKRHAEDTVAERFDDTVEEPDWQEEARRDYYRDVDLSLRNSGARWGLW